MATIALTKGSATAVGSSQLYGKPVKTLYFIYDLVDAVASKGSALAAGDVIQGLGIPGNSWVQSVAVKVNEAAAEGHNARYRPDHCLCYYRRLVSASWIKYR